jgi:hypothetical protein
MGLKGIVNRKATTYAHTGTAVAFIISELPGERAEALFFIAMAALVSTAGEQFTNRPGQLRVTWYSACETRRLNRRAP